MCDRDARNRVNTDDLILCSHGINHDAVDPRRKRFIYTGMPVIKHVQNLCGGFIRVFWLHDAVSTLKEICPGIVLYGLKCSIDFGIIVAFVAANSLVLKDEEEPPRKSLSAPNVTDQFDVFFTERAALCVVLLCQFCLYHCDVFVRISLSRYGLELQAHRGDFQPARKTGNNVVLFLIGPQCEIDGLDLQDLGVTAIGHFKDAIPQIPDSEIVLDKSGPPAKPGA